MNVELGNTAQCGLLLHWNLLKQNMTTRWYSIPLWKISVLNCLECSLVLQILKVYDQKLEVCLKKLKMSL